MEKWLILFSVFKDFLKTETQNTWWSWAREISLSLFKLIFMGTLGFAIWSLYSYLRGYDLEAVASIQMSGILLGAVAVIMLLYFLIKKIMKQYIKAKGKNNVYGDLFDLSVLLYKDCEKIKYLGASLFKKKPLLISATAMVGVYCLLALFKDHHLQKEQERLTRKKS